MTSPENICHWFINLYSSSYWNKWHLKRIVRKSVPISAGQRIGRVLPINAGLALQLADVWAAASLTKHKHPSLQLISQSRKTRSETHPLSAEICPHGPCGYKTMHVEPRRCCSQYIPTGDNEWKYNLFCVTPDECRMKGSNPKANGCSELQFGEG